MATFTCPVCGYPDLDKPAWDEDTPSFSICPCCGCTFGYQDITPEARLRFQRRWVAKGAPWLRPDLKPAEWDLRQQLARIGVNLDDLKDTEEATSHANLPEEKRARLRREVWVAEARLRAFRFALECDGDLRRLVAEIEKREEMKTSRIAASPSGPLPPGAMPRIKEDTYLAALREALAIVSDRPTSS